MDDAVYLAMKTFWTTVLAWTCCCVTVWSFYHAIWWTILLGICAITTSFTTALIQDLKRMET